MKIMNDKVRRFKIIKDNHSLISETSPSGMKFFICRGNFRIKQCWISDKSYYIKIDESERISNLSSEEKQNIINFLKNV